MGPPLYIETSALLRAVLERGTTPEIEVKLGDASYLLTSRLSLVESSRALLRARSRGRLSEAALADQERQLRAFWQQCEIWEVSRAVCELAEWVAAPQPLRSLDALHLATFVLARRRIAGLELLTADERLKDAAQRAGA